MISGSQVQYILVPGWLTDKIRIRSNRLKLFVSKIKILLLIKCQCYYSVYCVYIIQVKGKLNKMSYYLMLKVIFVIKYNILIGNKS